MPGRRLTSKPYAFVARPWELKKTDSIDVLDALGSNIRIDARGREVLRVLPRLHEDINEEWLSDKSRFAVDGLMRRRLDTPYVRKAGKLEPVSWDEALQATADKLNRTDGAKIAALAGDQADCEAMTALNRPDGSKGFAPSRLPPGRHEGRSGGARVLFVQHHDCRNRAG